MKYLNVYKILIISRLHPFRLSSPFVFFPEAFSGAMSEKSPRGVYAVKKMDVLNEPYDVIQLTKVMIKSRPGHFVPVLGQCSQAGK